jgi:hypothetical protein
MQKNGEKAGQKAYFRAAEPGQGLRKEVSRLQNAQPVKKKAFLIHN